MKPSRIRERVIVDVIRLAPKALFSKFIGWGARRTVPERLRALLYGAFADAVGVNRSEVELPLSDYKNFGDFFARKLKPQSRPFAAEPSDWVSPCDAYVAETGRLDGRTVQAKNRSFSLAALLASESLATDLTNGNFVTLYLSPRDYHRVHAPTDCHLVAYQYVPGTLFPVKPLFVKHIDGLFAANERLVLELESLQGRFALVMVAAAGVGNLRLNLSGVESRFLRPIGKRHHVRLKEPIVFRRGDELGAFELGSTVILCAPSSAVQFTVALETHHRLGESVGVVVTDMDSNRRRFV